MKKFGHYIFLFLASYNNAQTDLSLLFETFQNPAYRINHLELICVATEALNTNTDPRRKLLLEAQLRATLRSAIEFLENKIIAEEDSSILENLIGAQNAICRFRQIYH